MRAIRLAPLALVGPALVLSTAGMAGAAAPEGARLFVEYKCNRCHAVKVAGIARKSKKKKKAKKGKKKPPDLSAVGKERKPDWMARYLMKKVKLDGKKHKKKFRGSAKDLTTITRWLGTLKGTAGGK